MATSHWKEEQRKMSRDILHPKSIFKVLIWGWSLKRRPGGMPNKAVPVQVLPTSLSAPVSCNWADSRQNCGYLLLWLLLAADVQSFSSSNMIDTSKEIPVSWSPLFQHSDDQSDGMYFSLEHLIHPGLEVYKFSPSSRPQDAIAMVLYLLQWSSIVFLPAF